MGLMELVFCELRTPNQIPDEIDIWESILALAEMEITAWNDTPAAQRSYSSSLA